jgi:uncharacterized protein YyaL (SSP411 family)
MPNRLAGETSPYLQQHAENPVDWYPWGTDALERAKRENKPILLSVGYSACHWCHVMAHESFEDPAVAEVMNQLFVNVKVDREERPDLDQIYQLAHQMLAQRPGGWPLTMFLSPDGTPFFGGTYFPKTARYGLPGFADLCARVAAVWAEKRGEIDQQNEQVRAALARTVPSGGAHRSDFDAAPLDALRAALGESFDPRFGGFGGAPKFPHASDLEFCLQRYARLGDSAAREMAETTLLRMCEGGIYDQLGGGFCRYSTDATWTIPHFEKMLYDNGPLLGLLADAWIATGEARFARCAQETAAWIEREMQSAEGGYFSSLDADSEHVEGKFYVWERDAVRALLTPDEWAIAAPHYGLDEAPNFEGSHWNLAVARSLESVAQRVGTLLEDAEQALASARRKLFAERETRVRPGRDEKVLVSWNALAIRGMVRAGRVFDRADWIASARRALEFIHTTMWRDGRLCATYKDGRAHLNAYLDDYAFLLAALIEMMQAEFAPRDLEFAEDLAEVMIEQFEDRAAGGFFFTSRDHETLIHRPKPAHDNPTSSGNAMAAWALNRLAALTGDTRYSDAAERTLALFYPAMRQQPGGFAAMALALDELLTPPATAVLRGKPEMLEVWSRALAREARPDILIVAVADGIADLPPVLDKPAQSSPVTGWLCRGTVCLAPVADLEDFRRLARAAEVA